MEFSVAAWTVLLFCIYTDETFAVTSNVHSGPGTEDRGHVDGGIPSPILKRTKRMVQKSKSTTDIPEEREIEEGATNKDGLLAYTGAEDPTEENDLTRRLSTKVTPPTNFATGTSTTLPKETTRHSTPTTFAPTNFEAEELVNGGQGGTCPTFTDTTLEHHVILRQEGCEIFISQDDSIRWFGHPGESPPSVYMRHYK